MATYSARTPGAPADTVETVFTFANALAQIRAVGSTDTTIEPVYPFSAPTTPIRMRGKWSGGYVWWDSLDSQPDLSGRFYRGVSPLFSAITEIVIFS